MQAGRELDAEVLSKFYHKTVHHYHGDWPFGPADEPIPHYSTDIAAAWKLLEDMVARDRMFNLLWESGGAYWSITSHEVYSKSLPRAIALAAAGYRGTFVER